MRADSHATLRARKWSAATLRECERCLQQRDGKAAERLARQVLSKDHSHIAALELLAKALWQQNGFVELISVTKRLIRLDPYEPGYRLLLGAAYQCTGRYGDATRAYAAIPEQSPEHNRSSALVAELRRWQESLVNTLLREDSTFRLEYERDPKRACASRGFEFLSLDQTRAAMLPQPEVALAAQRPS